MKYLKKGLFITISIILSLILLYNIYNFISLKILKKDLATINGYAILEVASGSMEPTLKVGDLIMIDTKANSYRKNDIITFYDVNGSFVTHRLVNINKNNMITKGDANDSEDGALPTKNIIGKYVFKISGLGILMSSLKNPLVSMMILIIGFLICYLISTDRNGNPILDEEEQEFQEFLDNKNKEEGKKENKFQKLLTNLKLKFSKNKTNKKKKKKKKVKRVKKKTPKKNKKRKKKK